MIGPEVIDEIRNDLGVTRAGAADAIAVILRRVASHLRSKNSSDYDVEAAAKDLDAEASRLLSSL